MVNLDGFYPHLQPHHEVQVGDEVQVVVCPITNPDTGQGFQSSWSVNADPDEVECLFCSAVDGTRPELLGSDIPCDCDDPPPIGGGAHGGVHHVSEYQPCKVPLRTITWMGVRITVHEGCIASLMAVDDEWVRRGRPAFVRQRDTGAYNCRKTTSGRSWSKHAYGCAIDVNWSTNGYGKRTCDHPAWFIAAMKRQGYGHGLDWSGTKDPMHYSKFPNEKGDGRLYVAKGGAAPAPTPKPDEESEDDMNWQTIIVDPGKRVPIALPPCGWGADHGQGWFSFAADVPTPIEAGMGGPTGDWEWSWAGTLPKGREIGHAFKGHGVKFLLVHNKGDHPISVLIETKR